MINHEKIYDLTKWLDEIVDTDPIGFDILKPSSIPTEGGVYFISDSSHKKEEIVYVGLSGNLRQRIYTNQFQGDESGSQIKKAVIDHGRAKTWESAKEYLKENCGVRFGVVPDFRERQIREGFAIAILKPEFSLYKSKEH